MGRSRSWPDEWPAGLPPLLPALLLGLSGCAGADVASPTAAPPAPATLAPASRSSARRGARPVLTPAAPAPAAQLTPLASPRQVVQALTIGRPDPFAPLQEPAQAAGQRRAAGSLPPLALPPGFRLTGVMRSGGQLRAFVQVGDRSGPLCPGPRGRCPDAAEPPLLPPGWSVSGIDARNGLLALSRGGQRQVLSLAP